MRWRATVVFWAALLPCSVSSLAVTGCATEPPDARADWSLPPNRLFDGAPPTIPHQVAQLGRSYCMDCHSQGDAMDDGRPAPRTPHPELEICVQCHVEQNTDDLFVPNDFQGGAWSMGERAHSLAPWLIPHPLTMRENCLGCHGEDAQFLEIRTSHPERGRCLQCHVPANEDWPGQRPDTQESSGKLGPAAERQSLLRRALLDIAHFEVFQYPFNARYREEPVSLRAWRPSPRPEPAVSGSLFPDGS